MTAAAEAQESTSATVSGDYVVNLSVTRTALDGSVFSGPHGIFNMPPFDIVIHDTSGDGQQWSTIRVRETGGRFDDDVTSSTFPHGLKPDQYARTWTLSDILFHAGPSGPSPNDSVTEYEETADGSITAQFAVDLMAQHGGVQDTVDIDITIQISVTVKENTGGNTDNLTVTWGEVPQINLYEDGVLPPGGRPPVVSEPVTNTNTDGTITNNSDTQQKLTFHADLDQDGEVEPVYELTIEPGQTLPVDLGIDLEAGTFGYWTATGDVTGVGDPIQASGDSQTFDLAFGSEQEPTDIRLTIDNGDFITQPVDIGSDIPQTVIVAPPGISTVDTTVNGPFSIGGGTVHDTVTDPNGDQHIVISVPPTSEPATVVSTSTGPGGTTKIVVLPGGDQVVIGGDPVPTNPAAQDPLPKPPPAPTVSTDDSLSDAAAQLAAIRAEMAALGGSTPAADDFGSSGGLIESASNLGEAQAAVEGIIEDGGFLDGKVFFLENQMQPISIGQVSSVEIPIMNNSYTMDFDLPVVAWMRTFFLVMISVAWFFFMVKFAKV